MQMHIYIVCFALHFLFSSAFAFSNVKLLTQSSTCGSAVDTMNSVHGIYIHFSPFAQEVHSIYLRVVASFVNATVKVTPTTCAVAGQKYEFNYASDTDCQVQYFCTSHIHVSRIHTPVDVFVLYWQVAFSWGDKTAAITAVRNAGGNLCIAEYV